jgi:hypothetical protein
VKLEPVRPSRGPAPIRLPSGWRAPGTPWLVIGVVAVIALFGIAALPPDARLTGGRLAIFVIGLLVAWRVLGRAAAVTASSRERFEDALLAPPASPFEVPGLRAVETDVRMATANAFGVELRLKPVLRELARWRLQRDYGIDLDREPDTARRVLGEPAWPLVAPSEAFPDFHAAGMSLAEVDAAVDRLERL